MIVLGIHAMAHDTSAALVKNGKVVAAAEEERFVREKHTKKFPVNSVRYCLEEAGITVNDIDAVAISFKPILYVGMLLYNILQAFPKALLYTPRVINLLRRKSKVRKEVIRVLRDELKARKIPRIYYVPHHVAHAASAFYVSPFRRAAVLTVDGRGEYETAAVFLGRGSKLVKLWSMKFPHSVGYLYSAFTKYLGFKPQNDEGKVMALASYGDTHLLRYFTERIVTISNNDVKLNLEYFDHYYRYGKRRQLFSEKLIRELGPPRNPGEPLSTHHKRIARALQEVTEEWLLRLVNKAYQLTKERYLCMAGGVVLNCKANQKILEEGPFDEVFIQPAANDAGTSLGAALYVYHEHRERGEEDHCFVPYLGPSFNDVKVLNVLEKYRGYIKYKRVSDPCALGAELVSRGSIVGWFQGRMEWGPRALGNRSILADPRRTESRIRLDKEIKFREPFRPYAPSVLEEYAGEFFYIHQGGRRSYGFMIITAKVREGVANKIPAVVHVDGTARVQLVNERSNVLFYKLIREFYGITGIPMVLNTSFNIKGEPIVCSPEDALRTFLRTKLDYLIISNFLVEKITS